MLARNRDDIFLFFNSIVRLACRWLGSLRVGRSRRASSSHGVELLVFKWFCPLQEFVDLDATGKLLALSR